MFMFNGNMRPELKGAGREVVIGVTTLFAVLLSTLHSTASSLVSKLFVTSFDGVDSFSKSASERAFSFASLSQLFLGPFLLHE